MAEVNIPPLAFCVVLQHTFKDTGVMYVLQIAEAASSYGDYNRSPWVPRLLLRPPPPWRRQTKAGLPSPVGSSLRFFFFASCLSFSKIKWYFSDPLLSFLLLRSSLSVSPVLISYLSGSIFGEICFAVLSKLAFQLNQDVFAFQKLPFLHSFSHRNN